MPPAPSPSAPQASTPSDRLIEQCLTDELSELERFCAALLNEQHVLQSGAADQLLPIVDQKSALAGRLGTLLAARERALTDAGFVAGRLGMDAWLASRPEHTAIKNTWQRLLELTLTARQQQEINGKLIALQLQHNQQAITALMSASGRPLTYGPDGQQRVGGGGRTLGSA